MGNSNGGGTRIASTCAGFINPSYRNFLPLRSGRTGRILLLPTDTPPAEDTQHKSREGHEQEQEDDQRPDDDQHRINDDVKQHS